jgi:prepilin peptidase CpaA
LHFLPHGPTILCGGRFLEAPFLISTFFSIDALTPLQMTVIFCASLVGAGWDIATRRIPNWITFPMMITGLAWSTWAYGPLGLLGSFAALLLLALPYVLLFAYAGGGGGDAKIMAGIGAWAGLFPGLLFLGSVALAGVVVGTLYAVFRGQTRAVFSRLTAMAYRSLPALANGISGLPKTLPSADELNATVSQPLPYGIAIFSGVCLALAIKVLA